MAPGVLHVLRFKPLGGAAIVGLRRRIAPHASGPSRISGGFLVRITPPSLSGGHGPSFRPLRAVGGSDQVDDRGKKHARDSDSLRVFTWMQPLLDIAAKNFLPLALVGGIALGLADPTLGCLADKLYLSRFSTFGIFFISGLTLKSREIGAAIEAWPVGLFGLVSILLLSPFISKLILQIQLVPQEFVTGLAVFCCMPTTLSSGVALIQLAGGNSALALAMTVVSNLLGIMIVPFSLSKFIMTSPGASLPTARLLRSLVNTLLVPLVLGKVCRDTVNSVAGYVDQNRRSLSMTSALLLSLVPWIQVSRSRPLLLTVHPAVFAIAITMGTFLHLALLVVNTLAVRALSTVPGCRSVFKEKENARAVIIVASQKTLPVMVAVIDQLKGALGESGLLVLPCVASHIIQIIIDSFLVNLWLQKDRQSTRSREALS